MKTTRKFKTSWFMIASVAAVIVGEVIAWSLAEKFDLHTNPLVVGVLSVGLVGAIVSVLYDGCDIG